MKEPSGIPLSGVNGRSRSPWCESTPRPDLSLPVLRVRVRLEGVLGAPLFRDEMRPNSSEGPLWGAVEEVRVREKMLGMGSL